MITVIQRVSHASVHVDGQLISAIDQGILALVAVEQGDQEKQAERLAERLLGYRIFADEQNRMNQNIIDIKGDILLVPQFTLAADTGKGMRPSFTPAADPTTGERLFKQLATLISQQSTIKVACGQFGADMQVTLTNDGPVTFILRVPPAR